MPFSGGEKSRLMLCKLIQEDINLLMLDEPTNHLDIDSRENLEEALQSFKGPLLFISHDRYFINKVAERVSEISHYQIISYNGSYDYYREKVIEKKERLKEEQSKVEQKEIGDKKVKKSMDQLKHEVDGKRTSDKEKRQASTISASKLKKLEDSIQKAEALLQKLSEKMMQSGSDYIGYMRLEAEQDDVQKQLDHLMEEWLAMQEAVEREG